MSGVVCGWSFAVQADGVPIDFPREVHSRRQDSEQAETAHQQGITFQLQNDVEVTVKHDQHGAYGGAEATTSQDGSGVTGDQGHDTCGGEAIGGVETEMLRNSVEKMASRSGQTLDAQRAEITASNPQNRLVQPQEIAELVSFLCSDLSPALTMEDVQVNAGAHW